MALIHRSLEGIAFPPKEVVTVLSVTSSIRLKVRRLSIARGEMFTHGSPMLRTNGWLPSVGHMELNSRVSQYVSYKIVGTRTGWLAGQTPSCHIIPMDALTLPFAKAIWLWKFHY